MKDVFVVYEEYDEDFKEENNYCESCNVVGVYDTYSKALTYIDNELKLQCENDNAWTFKKCYIRDMVYFDMYFIDEWQYRIYCKKMEVK